MLDACSATEEIQHRKVQAQIYEGHWFGDVNAENTGYTSEHWGHFFFERIQDK